VVNIRVYVQRQGMSGQGAGSGFVLDDAGHIVTNHHVVAEAERVTVLFYDSTEVEAEIVGTDPQSDLAVIRVASMPDGVKPLPLTNSDDVRVGDWVIAIGNPFGLGGSMTVGIVSATGRVIPAAVTSFSIPQAIQTDAAINPGNSGGPLLNTSGEVIGVNAQIVSPGGQTNAGVGFAIPANIVRRVAPVLIDHGTYQWPWLGVRGTSLDLALAEANNLDTQKGAYIHEVISGGPAAEAGLQGSSGTTTVSGIQVPTGGDVVVAVNGEPVVDWSDLLANIALRSPGDRVTLTVIRDGQRTEIPVELEARSASQSD
jgi:S1-C subfamily serine protease